MAEAGHRKLTVWQKPDALAYQVYLATKSFPNEEVYGITSQLRRAALSVATNVVKGYARQSKNELRHFTNISLGSLAEVRYPIDFSSRLGYLSADKQGTLQDLAEEVGRLLWKSHVSIK